MANNRIAFALEQIQNLLDADSLFVIRKRWTPPYLAAGLASCYCYHASTVYGAVYESGRTEEGVMNIVVAFDLSKSPDPEGTGSADAAYADVVYRVEKIISASTWPRLNSDATFRTALNSLRVAGIDGHVDTSEDYIRFAIALEVPFAQATIA